MCLFKVFKADEPGRKEAVRRATSTPTRRRAELQPLALPAELSVQHRRSERALPGRSDTHLRPLNAPPVQPNDRLIPITQQSPQTNNVIQETSEIKMSCDLRKLRNRKTQILLAYLPSIAMIFCFGFHQGGQKRRWDVPLRE